MNIDFGRLYIQGDKANKWFIAKDWQNKIWHEFAKSEGYKNSEWDFGNINDNIKEFNVLDKGKYKIIRDNNFSNIYLENIETNKKRRIIPMPYHEGCLKIIKNHH